MTGRGRAATLPAWMTAGMEKTPPDHTVCELLVSHIFSALRIAEGFNISMIMSFLFLQGEAVQARHKQVLLELTRYAQILS
jgi:hypothetical protein